MPALRNYRLIIMHPTEANLCHGKISRFKINKERAVYGRKVRRDLNQLVRRHNVKFYCVNILQLDRFLVSVFTPRIRNQSLIAHLANLLRMLGDLLTAICDGDLSISLTFSALAFSKTWKRDLTFKLESSSSPRSGLSEAEKFREEISLLHSPWCSLPLLFKHLDTLSPRR